MMNLLFRSIKENQNLDALEESDDEDEFQTETQNQFVFMDKEYKMLCQFNNNFKKWFPLKVNDDGIVVKQTELTTNKIFI